MERTVLLRAMAHVAPVLAFCVIGACGGDDVDTDRGTAGAGGAGDGSGPSTGSLFVSADLETIRRLAPKDMPRAPIDVSNRFGDDPAAAALGEKLFFDTGFSGKLLDIDNDGSEKSLGVRGTSGKVSCAGCHESDAAFLDTRSAFREISLGTGWTGRRTPSLLDVGHARIVMWGGGRSTLYSQFFGPIENPLEMNSSRLFVAEYLATHYRAEYEAIFGVGSLAPLADTARFPVLTADTTGCVLLEKVDHPRALPPDPLYACRGMPGDGAEFDGMAADDQQIVTQIVVNAGKAVAAYERLLSCGPGRFDAWANGDPTALSAAEQRGVAVFIGKGKCVSCHDGPLLTDQAFHNVGLEEKATQVRIFNGNDRGALADLAAAAADPVGIASVYSDGDDGRMPETLGPELEGAFRTPSLRCVSRRPTFMHSGLLRSLEEVVAFFDRGGDPHGTYPGTGVLEPLGLTAEERSDLVAFLRALDGTAPVPTFR